MRKKKRLSFPKLLFLQILAMAWAPLVFYVITAKNYAGVVAGTGFLLIGIISMVYYWGNHRVKFPKLNLLGWWFFVILFCAPQIYIRIKHWQLPTVSELTIFERVDFYFTFQEFHKTSSEYYVVLFIFGIVSKILWFKK